ncbi:MAG: hypothetical protein IKT17_10275, partial [Lachnospiraceae bacterium]|nr:hypothetical protein [Lachnospiraceae bacterium]
MMRTIRHFCSRLLIKYIVAFMALSFLLTGCAGSSGTEVSNEIKIAVLIYDEYDTYIDGTTKYMTKWCRQKEKDDGIRITIDVVGAKKSQLTQNDQAE